ncbi:ATPase [Thermoplasmatales archaeon SW_10_69_26]|nr:MAG: ATPase [Thermoplasmatales archaeon SW_10_69_26]
MRRILVPDASVLVSGRLTHLIEEGDVEEADIVVPEAVLAQLEHRAVEGRESGVTGIDEVSTLQDLARDDREIDVHFTGERPHPRDLEQENETEIRGRIREAASQEGGQLVTSDRVQAHVSRARGLNVWYLHPWAEEDEPETEELELFRFFDDDVMSVHLKAGTAPVVKRGTPGSMRLEKLAGGPLEHAELSPIAREIIEGARRDPDAFVEIERPGATVCQLGATRVTIGRPPFSEGLEITATRPVAKLGLEAYDLSGEILERTIDGSRGIFISGSPGSGKSTFAQALADELHGQDTVVKTMEAPRDLQVDEDITQYAPLEGSMELTSDVLLLVRPDYVIYDEVRKTEDFSIFADMRLAGVGLVGVTHANRAIDAVQRLLGRVELGMIPQVVDTVIHIDRGQIDHILELELTVKVPEGMQEADLARPVVTVSDHGTGRALHEIYTYGEQTVVMPIQEPGQGPGGQDSRRDELAESQLAYKLRRHIDGNFEVDVTGSNSATVYVSQSQIASVIGSGGRNVQRLEDQLGVDLDIRTFEDKREEERSRSSGASTSSTSSGPHGGGGGGSTPDASERYQQLSPEVRRTEQNVVLVLSPEMAGEHGAVYVGDERLFAATIGRNGEIRVRRGSAEGQRLQQAFRDGPPVTVRV